MDYDPYNISLATGYRCRNLRVYNTMMSEIMDYAKKHYPQGEYEMFRLRTEALLRQAHLNTKDTEHYLASGNNHYTAHFWNLNFHEKHEGALHF